MVAAITTPFKPDMPPRGFGEGAHHLRGNGLAAGVFKHGLGALGIGLRLIADGLQAVDAVLERRIADIRKRLLQVLTELRDPRSEKKRLGERDAKRWTLTVAFVPAAHARG